MSSDGKYILCYYNLDYVSPTPMDRDKEYLSKKYGGVFTNITETTIYWEKPKYTLTPDEVKTLYADQVLENKDNNLWQDVSKKYYKPNSHQIKKYSGLWKRDKD